MVEEIESLYEYKEEGASSVREGNKENEGVPQTPAAEREILTVTIGSTFADGLQDEKAAPKKGEETEMLVEGEDEIEREFREYERTANEELKDASDSLKERAANFEQQIKKQAEKQSQRNSSSQRTPRNKEEGSSEREGA